MDSVMLNLHSGVVVQFPPSIAAIKQRRLEVNTAVFPVKENVNFTSVFRPRNEHTETRPNGIKRSQSPRRIPASGRTEDDVSKMPPSSDKKVSSVKQEEIISLFRRIQSSISKAELVSDEKKGTNPNQNKSAAQSVLEIIRQSRKQAKDKISLKGGNKQKPRTRSIPKKEEDAEHISSPVTDIKVTRPPSNFVKKSPIPFPSAPREKEERWSEASPAIAGSNNSTSRKIEEMKLQELKEFAKSRGVRGYSRLKKKELVELLRS
ncbi:rho-N domain-containing protein 1, chloroplastic [Rhodamnia argentea]|uniref:Rho-N domain-containing protein 1, chloroplastic n=1 Tax=Rhodamnia argentea TaxID=178133 RepID=A0A8B8QL58_9MYRT|nr:rho-N domain-containing protein 1, chloroplastic [Rhodamnia argentea]